MSKKGIKKEFLEVPLRTAIVNPDFAFPIYVHLHHRSLTIISLFLLEW
jgi:hypothetical protein